MVTAKKIAVENTKGKNKIKVFHHKKSMKHKDNKGGKERQKCHKTYKNK